jgi:hypothetical protein
MTFVAAFPSQKEIFQAVKDLGAPKAITAMAHTLARLIYRMLKFGRQYVDQGIEYYENKYRQQQLNWVAKQAATLRMQLVPLSAVAG